MESNHEIHRFGFYNLMFYTLFLFVLGTCIYFYIRTFFTEEKEREILFIESAVATLNFRKNVFTSIMRFHPKSYDLGDGTFIVTVEGATDENYVDFRVVDVNDEVLSDVVRVKHFMKVRIPFSVKNQDIDFNLEYKSSKQWPAGDINTPNLIRLELEH